MSEAVRPKAVPAPERLMLDRQAAAEMLSVCPKTLDKLPIPRVKIPGLSRVLYRTCDLELYVRSLL